MNENKEATTFNDEQREMFEVAEENQRGEATRKPTPGVQTDPVITGTSEDENNQVTNNAR